MRGGQRGPRKRSGQIWHAVGNGILTETDYLILEKTKLGNRVSWRVLVLSTMKEQTWFSHEMVLDVLIAEAQEEELR